MFKKIDLVYGSDGKIEYLAFMSVSIYSFLIHNQDLEQVRIHIFDFGISSEDKQKIQKTIDLFPEMNVDIIWEPTEKIKQDLNQKGTSVYRGSYAAYGTYYLQNLSQPISPYFLHIENNVFTLQNINTFQPNSKSDQDRKPTNKKNSSYIFDQIQKKHIFNIVKHCILCERDYFENVISPAVWEGIKYMFEQRPKYPLIENPAWFLNDDVIWQYFIQNQFGNDFSRFLVKQSSPIKSDTLFHKFQNQHVYNVFDEKNENPNIQLFQKYLKNTPYSNLLINHPNQEPFTNPQFEPPQKWYIQFIQKIRENLPTKFRIWIDFHRLTYLFKKNS